MVRKASAAAVKVRQQGQQQLPGRHFAGNTWRWRQSVLPAARSRIAELDASLAAFGDVGGLKVILLPTSLKVAKRTVQEVTVGIQFIQCVEYMIRAQQCFAFFDEQRPCWSQRSPKKRLMRLRIDVSRLDFKQALSTLRQLKHQEDTAHQQRWQSYSSSFWNWQESWWHSSYEHHHEDGPSPD